ncbi:MAG: hypothetical protein J6W10_05275 [Kiritimatiellae bacterium]|nr:hypothetical protein [Kiritimatiellia bacterium]
MLIQKMDAEIRNNIQSKLTDKRTEYGSFMTVGHKKQANEARQYIYGMTFVLNALGYDVVYTNAGKPVIISRDE